MGQFFGKCQNFWRFPIHNTPRESNHETHSQTHTLTQNTQDTTHNTQNTVNSRGQGTDKKQ